MTRITTLALALGAFAAAVPTGFADSPPVDAGRLATVTVTLALPDGDRLTLDLRALAGQAGDRLLVSTARCEDDGGCLTGERSGDLPDGALTIDPSTADATLHTQLGGQPLAITWRAIDEGTVLVGGVEAGGRDGSTEASSYDGAPATVTVDYLGGTCRETGGVGEGVAVDTSAVTGTPATAPLAGLRVRDGAVLACG
jgi:hypothetical protein